MLQKVLAGISVFSDPNVLVGHEMADDGGVYLLDKGRALVQTVDFFTPVVDDPFIYGQIAAANALSDVYAMGGSPRFALAIVGFPEEEVEEAVLHQILQGGTEKMKEAQVAVIGGHSVRDPELKFGYCVTGLIDPQKVYTNSGAQPGDALILTKPLGSGIIATGIKFQKASGRVVEKAIEWMLKLNVQVRDKLEKYSVHALTDITGNGLVGHAWEMARASNVGICLNAVEIPLMEGAAELGRQGMLPASIESNRHYLGEAILWEEIPLLQQQILLDPQTSGGLLLSLPEGPAARLAKELEAEGSLGCLIGKVTKSEQGRIRVK